MGDEKKQELFKPDVDDAELQVYADADGTINREDRIRFLKERYDQVQVEHKQLLLQRQECENTKREEVVGQIMKALRNNYRSRKWIVGELRLLGETITDKYVPG